MKGMSRREGRRGGGRAENHHEFDNSASAGKKRSSNDFPTERAPKQQQQQGGNGNSSDSNKKRYEHHLHGETVPQHQRGQVNARSSDPRDQAALKALAAQRNRKGGRSTLIGGVGAPGRGASSDTLLNSFKSRLSGSTFRLMNEQLYTTPSDFARQLLSNESAYKEYHEGYNRQLQLWPVNPVDIVLDSLKFSKKGHFDAAFHNMATKNLNNQNQQKWIGVPSNVIIADFGCGSAHLAKVMKNQFKLTNTIHSLDLCNKQEPELITECDMSEVPLEDHSVDIAIFSLSLMSTNWTEYLLEAHRVLKKKKEGDEKSSGGLLKIIEVRSRLPDPDRFAELVESIGYKFVWGDVVGEAYFCAFDFEAVEKSTKIDRYAEKLLPEPNEVLVPCLYKRR